MSWKDQIPEGWEWVGVKWKGRVNREIPVYIFRKKGTQFTKGFSAWEVNCGNLQQSKEIAVILLKKYISQQNEIL